MFDPSPKFMLLALELARSKQGFCAPNPAVGAVIVADGKVVGQGCHHGSGHDHAEIVALKEAGSKAKGATLYVSLIPCHHQGKTPPCTQAIIASGIAEVFYGHDDLGKQVDTTHSIDDFQAAGIRCERLLEPDLQLALESFYQAYDFWCENTTPWVSLKLAMSLDGKIAGAGGYPESITGTALQQLTHQFRSNHDGILTTFNTIKRDDPQLNVRFKGVESEVIPKPVFVLDRRLHTPMDCQIWHTAKSLTFFFDEQAVMPDRLGRFIDQGAACIPIPILKNHLDWQAMMRYIGQLGYHSIFVEAGGQLVSALLSDQSVQRAWLYFGRRLLGETALSGLHPKAEWSIRQAKSHWRDCDGEAVCELSWEAQCLQD